MEVGIPSPRMTAEHQGVYQGPTKSLTLTQVKAQLQGELKTKDEQLQKQAAKSRATAAGVMYVDWWLAATCLKPVAGGWSSSDGRKESVRMPRPFGGGTTSSKLGTLAVAQRHRDSPKKPWFGQIWAWFWFWFYSFNIYIYTYIYTYIYIHKSYTWQESI